MDTQPFAETESVGWPPSGTGSADVETDATSHNHIQEPVDRSRSAPNPEGERLSRKRKRPSEESASEPRRTKRKTVRQDYQRLDDPGFDEEWAYLDRESGHVNEERPTEIDIILAALAENGSFDPNEP
jgi:hypothetical protein